MIKTIKIRFSDSQRSKIRRALNGRSTLKIHVARDMIGHGEQFLVNATEFRFLDGVGNGTRTAYNLPISSAFLDRNRATIKTWKHQRTHKPHPLTDIEINRALPHKWFLGCHMHDQLPSSILPDSAIVINLDDSDGSGTHWVACGDRKGVKYYFDSFGLPPSDRIRKLLTGKAFYSDSQIQQSDSVTCGYFCILWLRKLFEEGGYDSVYQFDQKDSDANELKAENAINII